MKFFQALFINIFKVFMDFRKIDSCAQEEYVASKVVIYSATVCTILILLNFAFVASFLPKYLVLYFLFLIPLPFYLILKVAANYKKLVLAHKHGMIDKIIFPYVVITVVTTFFIRHS